MSLGLRTGRLSASSAPRARARAPSPWCSIENRLFNRTVRENIALRDPALPMELAYLRIWGQSLPFAIRRFIGVLHYRLACE